MILRSTLRTRVGAEHAHYGGGLVDGAFVLKLFGDAATELLVRNDGDEGLFRAYSAVEFLAPVRGGDYLEVSADLVRIGRTSREMTFEAVKVIEGGAGSSARVLQKPVVVARARGTCVVALDKQNVEGDAEATTRISKEMAARVRIGS
jgi:3-aminobutyryl-CoA ammonia-lyase